MLIVACSTDQILSPDLSLGWLDQEESDTQSIMQTLAISISRLEDAVIRESSPEVRQQTVDAQLQIIEELGELLATEAKGKVSANSLSRSHQVIDDNIDTFLLEVRQARKAIAHESVNYFVAGVVVGYCKTCHQVYDHGAL